MSSKPFIHNIVVLLILNLTNKSQTRTICNQNRQRKCEIFQLHRKIKLGGILPTGNTCISIMAPVIDPKEMTHELTDKEFRIISLKFSGLQENPDT